MRHFRTEGLASQGRDGQDDAIQGNTKSSRTTGIPGRPDDASQSRSATRNEVSRLVRQPCIAIQWPNFVVTVERGDLIGLGKGWIVEYGVDEVVQTATESHNGLTDVD